MSFSRIDPSGFYNPGQSPITFTLPEGGIISVDPLSQPASDPSVVMDIDKSVAIDRVRALLGADFTSSRASWIHLLASILSDAQNGIRNSINNLSLSRFQNLSSSETASLNHLQLAITSLDEFFTNLQDESDDWATCMGCAKSFQLPFNKNEWDVNLTECSDLASDACKVLLDHAIAEAHTHIQTWVNGKRVAAQDAAILHLTADHTPLIADLVGDMRVVEWSRRILEAMRHHLMEQHVMEASASLPQSLIDRLDAERQAKYNSAEEDACAEAKRLYHAKLQSLQASAIDDTKRDFEAWKESTLFPEWRTAEATARADKLQELDAFKHQLSIKTEELKENARIVAAKSLVHTRSDRESRHKDKRPKPVGVSCSVSRTHSPSPTPSQKRDKTPTKADYLPVSQTVPPCAPGSDYARGRARPSVAQEVSKLREILTYARPLVGAEVAKASAESLTPSCSTSVAALPSAAVPVLPIPASLDHAVAPAAPLGDASPSPAEPPVAHGTGTTENPTSDSRLVERFGRYQSATPSLASPPSPPPKSTDDRMMRLLGASISSALAPVKSSIEDISSRLRLVEGKQSWAEMVNEDTSMENFDPHWGAGDDQNPQLSYATASRSDPVVVKLEEEDTYDAVASRDAYEATFGVGTAAFRDTVEGSPIDNREEPHVWFEYLTREAFKIPHTVVSLDGYHVTFTRQLVDLWEQFCDDANLSDCLVPPLDEHWDIFVTIVNNQVRRDRAIAALRGEVPRFSPPIDLAHRRAQSDPISISSDSSKISGFTETSVAPPMRHITGVLDLDTPPPGDGHGWTVAGGKKGRSFAQIAASSARRPTPTTAAAPLAPTVAQAAHGFLTKLQLNSLTKDQVIAAYNARFMPRLNSCRTSKDQAVVAFLEHASRPALSAPPPPRPVHKTEFTLVFDTRAGDLAGPSGHRGDAASYVRSIQQHVRNAGTKQAEVIGGR